MTKIHQILFLIGMLIVHQKVSAQTTTFSYTGAAQTYIVPAGCTSVLIDLAGASGGNSDSSTGGKGGRIQCTLAVTAGEVLKIYVGGAGANHSTGVNAGGYNGGGSGDVHGAGGGGGTDIRIGGTALTNRMIMGAGGGGGGYNCGGFHMENGGDAGGDVGSIGYSCGSISTCYAGSGANLSTPGAGASCYGTGSGTLGIGGSNTSLIYGGGGGGGWAGGGSAGYGGGGGGGWAGGGSAGYGGGGGGSSYPATGTTCTTGPGTGILTGITNTGGFSTGNGYCIITLPCPGAGTISGPSLVYTGSTITLTDAITGGTWTSSNTAVATVGATTGIVTGVSAGSATISYAVTCGGTISYATHAITDSTINRISGHVNYTSGAVDSTGTTKVWLIKYDTATHMLSGIDSVSLVGNGTSFYYQFLGAPVDSYRVKAAFYPAVFSSTGYIPTYHTSNAYWHSANVLNHGTGSDDGTDINMGYGTVTSGPGFIAGDVTTGANKGTSGSVPAVGLLVFLKNAAGNILQHTYTNSTGNFSFGSLPVGQTYSVYPEAVNYATTPYTGISLTSTIDTIANINFVQHTISHTITPVMVHVMPVSSTGSAINVFPNPTEGLLNINWNITATEKISILVINLLGQEVYNSNKLHTQGQGTEQIDLSKFSNGTYMLTIKSASINYSGRINLVSGH